MDQNQNQFVCELKNQIGIKVWQQFQSLSVQCSFSFKNYELLGNSILHEKDLKAFEFTQLSHNYSYEDSFKYIFDALEKLEYLQKLKIQTIPLMKFGIDCSTRLSKSLLLQKNNIIQLKLILGSCNKIDNQCIQILMEGIQGLSKLEKLKLFIGINNLSSDFIISISRAIQSLTCLNYVSLFIPYQSKVNTEAIQALSDSLQQQIFLNTLKITIQQQNGINEYAINTLLSSISHLMHLKKLAFRFSKDVKLVYNDPIYYGLFLGNLDRIISLDLRYGQVKVSEIFEVLAAIIQLKQLQKFVFFLHNCNHLQDLILITQELFGQSIRNLINLWFLETNCFYFKQGESLTFFNQILISRNLRHLKLVQFYNNSKDQERFVNKIILKCEKLVSYKIVKRRNQN